MKLREALGDISAQHYSRICGYTYRPLRTFGDRKFHELPKDYRDGIVVMILRIYELQKMVYHYDIEFVIMYMKKNGIIIKPFFGKCDLPKYFFQNHDLGRNPEIRLIVIRLELIRTLNRLFSFYLDK